MKKLVFIILLIYSSSGLNIFAASNTADVKADTVSKAVLTKASSDSVDIRAMVESQIKAARKKQNDYLTAKKLLHKTSSSTVSNLYNFITVITKKIGISAGLLIKLSILFFATILAFLIIYIRRRKQNPGIQNNELKKNIALLREEKLPEKIIPERSKIRFNLQREISHAKLEDRRLSERAKTLKIAKGELILAAKINDFKTRKKALRNENTNER